MTKNAKNELPEENETQLLPLIHKKLTVQAGHNLLRQKGARWLIRESSKEGCLTVDYLSKNGRGYEIRDNKPVWHSIRFGYINESGNSPHWMVLSNNEDYERVANSIEKVTMGNVDLHSKELLDSLKMKEFTLDTGFLHPTRDHVTVNEHYVTLEIAENIIDDMEANIPLSSFQQEKKQQIHEFAEDFEKQECPITLDRLPEKQSHSVSKSGAPCDEEGLRRWVSIRGADPLTREQVTPEQIISTSVFGKLFAKSQAIDALEQKNNNQAPNKLATNHR